MTAARRSWALLAILVGLAGCDRLLDENSADGSDSSELPPGAVPVGRSGAISVPDVQPPPPPAEGGNPLLSFAALTRKTGPSVVTIRSWKEKSNKFGRKALESDGVGTGFVYDSNGFLLTNNHVIEGADLLVARFPDGSESDATVVGADKQTDIAVIRIARTDLAALPLGDSDQLQVGDWVIAIGNPFGLEQTVSAGILSAKGRTRDDVRGLDPTGYYSFLQTDASINPGNSGGPLLNIHGQVVGINAAVRANANNIGFAIPIKMVVQLLPKLLKHGKIRRSAVGIVVDEVSAEDVERLGLQRRQGARISQVVPGKAAARAGLKVGDIVLVFDGKTVGNPHELRWLASIAGVDETVTLQVARGERTFDLPITLDALTP